MQNQVAKNASPPMKHSIPFKKFYNAKLDIIPVLKYPANVQKNKKVVSLYHKKNIWKRGEHDNEDT